MMTTITFSKKSWHYRLALYYSGGNQERIASDFCTYFWQVIIGFFYACLLTVVSFTLLEPIVDLAVWSIVSLKHKTFIPMDEHAIIAIVLFVFFAVVGLICTAIFFLFKDRDFTANPTFIQLTIQKFKDRVCSKINFKNDD